MAGIEDLVLGSIPPYCAIAVNCLQNRDTLHPISTYLVVHNIVWTYHCVDHCWKRVSRTVQSPQGISNGSPFIGVKKEGTIALNPVLLCAPKHWTFPSTKRYRQWKRKKNSELQDKRLSPIPRIHSSSTNMIVELPLGLDQIIPYISRR